MRVLIVLIIVTNAVLSSCKKDRTCTCKYTPVSETRNGVSIPNTSEPYSLVYKYDKVTKSSAACNNREKTTTTYINTNKVKRVVVEKVECKLE